MQVVEEEHILLHPVELVAQAKVRGAFVPSADGGHHLPRHADEGIDVFWLVHEPAAVGEERVALVGFLHPIDDGFFGGKVIFHVCYALVKTHEVSPFLSSGSSSISRSKSNSGAEETSRLRTAASSGASRSSGAPASGHLSAVWGKLAKVRERATEFSRERVSKTAISKSRRMSMTASSPSNS